MHGVVDVRLFGLESKPFTAFTSPREDILPSFPWVEVREFLTACDFPEEVVEHLVKELPEQRVYKVAYCATDEGEDRTYLPLLSFIPLFHGMEEQGFAKGLTDAATKVAVDVATHIYMMGGGKLEEFQDHYRAEMEHYRKFMDSDEVPAAGKGQTLH